MYRKNELKNLIYIQENKPCSEQTIKGLFRSIVEPILENNLEGLILCRLQKKSQQQFNSTLKRLEYSKAKIYDFSEDAIGGFENVLKENIWDRTEFVYVLAERFGAVVIFDYEESDMKGFAGIYIMHNSKILSDTFEIINSNSKADLSLYQEKYHPDRRDNDILNNSIRKIVEVLNESNQDVLISELQKENTEIFSQEDLASRLDFISNQSRYVAHEIRNQLSICELYSTIIQKQLAKIEIEDNEVQNSLNNAINCVQKSLKMASGSLFDLKSLQNIDMKHNDLKTLISNSVELAKVYVNEKDVKIKFDIPENINILTDEDKFLAVLINLIKNGIESIGEVGEININTEVKGETVSILISNNGEPISKEIQERIFEEGFTTKKTGSGLGLYICKKSLEEQYAQLKLNKSDEVSTEFEITLLK